MKRTLVLAAVSAAALLVPAPAAQADHVCVYSEGREIYCTPHLDKQPDPICVTDGGRPVVCVP